MKKENLDPVYDCLLRVRREDSTIRRKELQREQLRSCLTRYVPVTDGVKVQSSKVNRLEETEARIDELDHELDDLNDSKAASIIRVSDLIELLDDENEKTVLTAFYIAGMSMQDTADMVNYSLQHTYRIRKRGIVNLKPHVKDEKNEKK